HPVGCCVFRAREWLRAYAHFHDSRAVSVTGWGHGGGRYSQRLRVGSSRSERRLIEALLLGCGLVSGSGLLCGSPRARRLRRALTVLRGGLGIPGLTLRRRLVGLLRLAEPSTLPAVTLREVLDAVPRHLHLRLPLVHVRAGDIAGNDY